MCRRNPTDHETPRKVEHKRADKCYGTQAKNACVYCEVSSHKSVNCPNVVGPEERRKVLRTKRLCFNCTGSHFASNYKSKASCEFCHLKHYSSIHSPAAEKTGRPEKVMAAHTGGDNAEVIYPVVIVEVDEIRIRALLDTGSGRSYASEKLIQALDKKPLGVRTKNIEMMLGSRTTKVEEYSVNTARSSRETSSLCGRTDPTPVGWRCCNHQGRVAEPQHVEARDCAESDCRARWNRESSQAESWKGGYQRAVQQLYPLELSVDLVQPKTQTQLNPTLPPFRPRRAAAVTACRRIQEIAQEEQEQ